MKACETRTKWNKHKHVRNCERYLWEKCSNLWPGYQWELIKIEANYVEIAVSTWKSLWNLQMAKALLCHMIPCSISNILRPEDLTHRVFEASSDRLCPCNSFYWDRESESEGERESKNMKTKWFMTQQNFRGLSYNDGICFAPILNLWS